MNKKGIYGLNTIYDENKHIPWYYYKILCLDYWTKQKNYKWQYKNFYLGLAKYYLHNICYEFNDLNNVKNIGKVEYSTANYIFNIIDDKTDNRVTLDDINKISDEYIKGKDDFKSHIPDCLSLVMLANS